ncbi:hypothetical protein E0Z10_g7318 [Xylaria hypoxylon]|uniref:Uncharacterized protein n=1 Tax=Xylaria hypoxylon TaxID=37992 RepID=A0A4Z0YE77_9PEZI|nr:hypothetical protein E0Z10_g7318 [Xylaria hypoxylon]
MTDTLKSSMLDSVDVEPSKPSKNTAAEAYCATVISNLEGWKGLTLPCTRESRRATIEQLDTRVRRLENRLGINPPPPMDTPSWDSLMWRVARLHRNMAVGAGARWSAAPPVTPTLSLLRSTVTSIGGIGPQSWALFTAGDDLQEDDLLEAAAQFLCHLAGKRNLKIVGSFELKQICKLALDLSLGTTGGLGPGVLSWMTGKYQKEKQANKTGVKARIAGVFRKLAFWRRRHDGDETDSDTSSTRSSSTL